VNIHFVVLTVWSWLQLFCAKDGRKDILKIVQCVWQSARQFRSTQYEISHSKHFDLTLRVTPLSKHTRHRLSVFRPGQCLLWGVSSVPMLLETRTALPTSLDGRGSCPAPASISLTWVSRKSV